MRHKSHLMVFLLYSMGKREDVEGRFDDGRLYLYSSMEKCIIKKILCQNECDKMLHS